MNVLKAAIVGVALISGNTMARADVIADWNNIYGRDEGGQRRR